MKYLSRILCLIGVVGLIIGLFLVWRNYTMYEDLTINSIPLSDYTIVYAQEDDIAKHVAEGSLLPLKTK